MSRADVEAMLDQSVIAFDRSVEVYHTPTPYGFTIRPHLRPYLAEATQEMIDEGNHREAMFWISALAGESYLVLQNDAPDGEKPIFAAQLQTIHAALGYADTSADAWAEQSRLWRVFGAGAIPHRRCARDAQSGIGAISRPACLVKRMRGWREWRERFWLRLSVLDLICH